MRLYVVVAVLLLLVVPAWAQPAPTFEGPTGLIFVPTADVIGMGEFNVGGALAQLEGVDANWISANVGLLPQLEVGATRMKPEGGDAETMVNAKFRLAQPTLTATTISVGAIDITDQVDRSLYAVLSHDLSVVTMLGGEDFTNPRVHVGIGGGQLNGLFAGAQITYDDKVELMAEYDTEDINLGARLLLSKTFKATVAALNGFSDFGVGAAFTSAW